MCWKTGERRKHGGEKMTDRKRREREERKRRRRGKGAEGASIKKLSRTKLVLRVTISYTSKEEFCLEIGWRTCWIWSKWDQDLVNLQTTDDIIQQSQADETRVHMQGLKKCLDQPSLLHPVNISSLLRASLLSLVDVWVQAWPARPFHPSRYDWSETHQSINVCWIWAATMTMKGTDANAVRSFAFNGENFWKEKH